jgi:hypothetical protein
MGRLVTSMKSLGQDRLNHDHPAQPWVADWQTLIQLREAYANVALVAIEPRRTG